MLNTNNNRKYIITIVVILIITVLFAMLNYFNLLPKITYSAKHFGIKTIYSGNDFNNNGTDDYTDILLGARADAKNHPKYDGSYHSGGYPPDNIGVCTDVIWRAFKNAGYCLKDMVDKDITLRPEAYTNIVEKDSNIDFRRVVNLHVFFKEHAVSLTTDITEINEWQPGDIVIFGDDDHIGIISDKRNKKGIPYVIHNGGQLNREEDYLSRAQPTAHYRFDTSLTDKDILVKWE